MGYTKKGKSSRKSRVEREEESRVAEVAQQPEIEPCVKLTFNSQSASPRREPPATIHRVGYGGTGWPIQDLAADLSGCIKLSK